MTLDEEFRWIESLTNFERRPVDSREYRLDRMEKLLELFDDPHQSMPMIHIAGSKGKGSVATLLAYGLGAIGKRVGLYRSPHISDYRERITLGGKFFSDHRYGNTIRTIRETLGNNPDLLVGEPTTFEILTLLGFLIFRDEGCDIGVIEVGLGGRLDATNLLVPVVSIITTLELEHTDILGPTLTHIAREKAGIIKPGIPAFSFPQKREALEVLDQVSYEKNSPLYYPVGRNSDDQACQWSADLSWEGSSTEYENEKWTSVVPGTMHLFNTIFAAKVLEFLYSDGPKALWRRAMACGRIPGRMEVRKISETGLPIILDGAHTVESAKLLESNLQKLAPEGFVLVLGIVEGKDSDGILQSLGSGARELWITTPGTFKSSNPKALAQRAREILSISPSVHLEVDTFRALEMGLAAQTSYGCPLVVSGSFYLLGEADRWFSRLTL